MAFYLDNRYGDIVFSEHEFYGGNMIFPRELRPQIETNTTLARLINDFPNIYGDAYEYFKAKGDNDPLWKVDHFKEVRAARDRGDRSDRSIWPHVKNGGYAKDFWGYDRSTFEKGAFTRVSEPIFGTDVTEPGCIPLQFGDQVYYGGLPYFYPY